MVPKSQLKGPNANFKLRLFPMQDIASECAKDLVYQNIFESIFITCESSVTFEAAWVLAKIGTSLKPNRVQKS